MKTRAFTLLELIIVIAVIGVLAAILIPIFSNVIDKANAKSALSDAKNSMEQVIIEGTENEAMPENILIIVKKAKNFYVYGFNRLTDGCLYQSPGNPFKGFSDVQSLIAQRSWNALQGDTAPDLETAYTDHDTYGYFYLVPYAGGESQAPTVRGMRATSEYPEISDPTNGLMTENMGDDVHIYHGILTDKVNTEAQTQGDTNATPTPAVTPTPSNTPDSDYILISEASQLSDSFFTENGADRKYRLANDITLTGNFTPIGVEFAGELDGNGKTISGLNIIEPNTVGIGLFRTINGANLHDFTVIADTIFGECHIGTICGEAIESSFINIHVIIRDMITELHKEPNPDSVNFSDYDFCIGGLCAIGSLCYTERCSVKGEICGNDYGQIRWGGGLFAAYSGTIKQSYYSGKMKLGCKVGGLVCMMDSEKTLTIEDCYAALLISDIETVGGIVGLNNTDAVEGNSPQLHIHNCVSYCSDILFTGLKFNIFDSPIAIGEYTTERPIDITDCYALEHTPLNYQSSNYGGLRQYSCTFVSEFTSENCPGLDTSIWQFGGEYPTLINNPE